MFLCLRGKPENISGEAIYMSWPNHLFIFTQLVQACGRICLDMYSNIQSERGRIENTELDRTSRSENTS